MIRMRQSEESINRMSLSLSPQGGGGHCDNRNTIRQRAKRGPSGQTDGYEKHPSQPLVSGVYQEKPPWKSPR